MYKIFKIHANRRQGELLNHQGMVQFQSNKQQMYATKYFKDPNLIPKNYGGFAHLATCKLFLWFTLIPTVTPQIFLACSILGF